MLGKTNVKVKPNKKVDYVEYIESTGTQYIDTGIVPKSTTRMEIKLKYNDLNGNQTMGWGSGSSQEAFHLGFIGVYEEFIVSVSSNYSFGFSGVPKDEAIHTFDLKSGSQKIDGVQFGTDTIGNTASVGQTLFLFALYAEWVTSRATDFCKCNLYYCKLYDGDTLVRDFKPVKDGAGIYCLYDEVEKRYYYNQGSGSFTGGA